MKSTTKSLKWRRQRRPTDELMSDGRPDDFIVAIMGPTGVGKSTFLNNVAGRNETVVGHSLVSCTQTLHPYIMENHALLPRGRRLVLVDTPGFDDTYIDDSEILRRIAIWLAASYNDDMKLGGIIYLYDISARRLTGSVRLNLKMIEKLCGMKAFDRIVIGTTKWSAKIEDQARARQQELTKDFWKGLISRGSRVLRVDDNPESCRQILREVLMPSNASGRPSSESTPPERVLRIQQELVNEEKLVPRTDAGKLLRFSLSDMLQARKQELSETKNPELQQKLQEDIAFLSTQIDELNTSFFQRLLYRLRPAPGS